MKWIFATLILIPIVVIGSVIFSSLNRFSLALENNGSVGYGDYQVIQGDFILKSLSFLHKQKIPTRYTCEGKNVNPPLRLYNIPDGTESLALTMVDADGDDGNFTHWILWNIDSTTESIKENSVPKGAIHGVNDFGKNKYRGPCPPDESHRYFFTLYALDSELDIPEGSTIADLKKAIKEKLIDEVGLIGIFGE